MRRLFWGHVFTPLVVIAPAHNQGDGATGRQNLSCRLQACRGNLGIVHLRQRRSRGCTLDRHAERLRAASAAPALAALTFLLQLLLERPLEHKGAGRTLMTGYTPRSESRQSTQSRRTDNGDRRVRGGSPRSGPAARRTWALRLPLPRPSGIAPSADVDKRVRTDFASRALRPIARRMALMAASRSSDDSLRSPSARMSWSMIPTTISRFRSADAPLSGKLVRELLQVFENSAAEEFATLRGLPPPSWRQGWPIEDH